MDNLQMHTSVITEKHKPVRLLEYLLRLALLRTKLVRNIAGYEIILWLSDIPREKGCFTRAWGRDEDYGDSDIWIEVQTRREPELPTIPHQCEGWIDKSSLRNKNDLPELLSERIKEVKNPEWQDGADEPEYTSITEHLDDLPGLGKAWERYLEDLWLPWVEDHNTWESVHKAYSTLFAIHQEQLRLGEEYELVLGLGLLTWQTPAGQRVRRHLIVADAVLDFEAGLGKFTVRPHPEGAKLRPELDMLDVEEQPMHADETAKASLVDAGDDPWEKACTEDVLRTLVHSINSQGEYTDYLEAKKAMTSEKPVVQYAPALILRKRSGKGLTETLKRIKKRIEQGEAVPAEFADLAEIRGKAERKTGSSSEEQNHAFDGEIFFPKPSNEEQRRIVDKIRSASGVLVQGPPGTGKSHTIANLICHLLATGQRTLITAKTPRALQVLEGLIPRQLRPLCINLLGSGPEERRSLESSVGSILRKNEEWNEESANRELAEFEQLLQNLREEQAKINRRLRDIRESETHTQSIADGAYQGTAARIAEAVNRQRPKYEWFTDKVPLNQTCSFSADELGTLLGRFRSFTPEKREELNLLWSEAFAFPEEFARLVQDEARATEEERVAASRADERIADLLSTQNSEIISAIHNALSELFNEQRRLKSSRYSWMADAIRDVLRGNPARWSELARVTGDIIASVEPLVEVADNHSINSRVSNIKALYDDGCKLKEHMENGGKLGWGPFRPKTMKERLYVIKTVRVNGHPCSTVEYVSVLCDVLHVQIECEKAWGFWVALADKAPGPYAQQLTALKSMLSALEDALLLEDLIEECRKAIRHCGAMSELDWTDELSVEKLIASCQLAQARHRKRLAVENIQGIEAPISSISANSRAHPVTNALLAGIRERDLNGYAKALSKTHELKRDRKCLQEVDESLSELSHLLPCLADELERTSGQPYWDERLRHIEDAWRWGQARYWTQNYIRQEDLSVLDNRAKEVEDEINETIAKLASLHAWSFCFSRLQEDHRRHMEAWRQSMRRLGKGTGKHAPRHRREARDHLNQCREAVPAWVMPLHRVWDTVDPAPGMFDVIIVDEASQCGVEALPLFYLGKKILIVGDDKQISPEAGFINENAVFQLMEQFLYDFDHKDSFHRDASLFDHGKLRYGTRRITLREHFRCMPEIIRFSNDLCYTDTPLIPLRQYGPNRLPPLKRVFVESGYREGTSSRAINRPEAEAIVEKLRELCFDDSYAEKTMGVIVLQGHAQAGLIENLLLERLGAAEMERRRLICGNPYSFQGDERDVIFLSMVAAPNERIGPFTKSADERRFNVAASRARDQMWLFHSVKLEDLSEKDLRRRLLEFFENSRPQQIAGIDRDELERKAKQENRSIVKAPIPFGSWFEVDVALELLRRGFIVTSQFELAGKRIDLVVGEGPAHLAVECDGDHWHGADRYEEDMQRQRKLERGGLEFFRLLESVFRADKDAALLPLWKMLEERGILPAGNVVGSRAERTENDRPVKNSIRHKEDVESDESPLSHTPSETVKGTLHSSGHRAEDVTQIEIRDSIVHALSKCPNRSCTVDSLTYRVLKEVRVLTRGSPRRVFEQRVMGVLDTLEDQSIVQKYKAKNNRIRLKG